MIRPIEVLESGLKEKSASVTDFEAVKEVITDLLDTAKKNADNCAGLAANQIGELLRVCVYLNKKGEYVPLVNPKIMGRSKEVKRDTEGCLSRPGMDEIEVRRYKWITIKHYDLKTKAYTKTKLKDFQARIVQHEIDHMNGVLI